MTEDQAVERVEGRREEIHLDPDLQYLEGERAVVEFKRDRDVPGPTENRVAWVLRFMSDWGYADVHVDDRSGDILHVRRSA